jgi:putative peptidoglycan lipid II flippase
MLFSTLARGLSLIGSMRYTAWFGYTLETDIYTYAVNLPNLIFTCIGTALVTVVIPIFSGRLASGESDKAYGFINNIITISLILAAFIASAGILASPLVVGMIDNFRTGDSVLALFALRLMFPVILFHAVNYILQGVLQSNGRFLLPAIVSAFSGISVIFYMAFFAGRFGIRGLLIATFIGLASQALVLIPPVAGRIKYRYRPALNLSDDDVRLAGRLALPVLVSASAYQFNMFMNSTFAAGFDGGVLMITNMLTLAFTASQLFIISALSVFFPRMSARYAIGDVNGFRETLNTIMRLILVFALPASAALAYLSRLLIPLLYGRGNVTEADMAASIAVFSIYAGAIAAIGFKEAADRAFYAIRDSRTPACVSVAIMALNIILSFLLMRKIGIFGLPVAYFAAITSGAAILLLILRKRLTALRAGYKDGNERGGETRQIEPEAENAAAHIDDEEYTGANKRILKDGIMPVAIKCVISTCIMLAALVLAELPLNAVMGAYANIAGAASAPAVLTVSAPAIFAPAVSAYGRPVIEQAIRLAVLIAIGGGAYAASACALGVDEIRGLFRIGRLRKPSRPVR